jgi:homospermidine synthase
MLYLDTVVEPWAGGYTDARLSVQQRSNYAQREAMLATEACICGEIQLLQAGRQR